MIISNHVLQLLKEIAVLFPVFLLVFTFRGFMQACVANLMGISAREAGHVPIVRDCLVGVGRGTSGVFEGAVEAVHGRGAVIRGERPGVFETISISR